MPEGGRGTSKAKRHSFVSPEASTFNIVSKVGADCLGYCYRIESRCEVEAMDPSVSTEFPLLCADVSLRCREDMSDPVERIIVLADPPFLWLCGVICHGGVFCLG